MVLKKLSSIVQDLNILESRWSGNPEIRSISYDSREVQKGSLFVAMEGFHTDGHLFIDQAIKHGAAAVLHSQKLPVYHKGFTYIRVENSLQALSPLSACFFDHPSQKLNIIGVTGTDGKSTTVWLIHQLLEALGKPSGFLSTVNFKTGQEIKKNPLRQSTPEAPELQGLLKKMVDAGKQYAVIEATSHGLSRRTNRLGDVLFNVAVLTNLTHDHLEFHGSTEQYRRDKANLFLALPSSGEPDSSAGTMIKKVHFGVVNRDDPNHSFFISRTKAPVHTYSTRGEQADLYASDFIPDIMGTSFTIHLREEEEKVRLNLPGLFNIENLLAAVLAVTQLLKVPLNAVCPFFPSLKGVKGRIEIIDEGQPFGVIVDYAHTPESFDKLFSLVRKYTKGSLLAVFGSAGERDLEKRARQGRIASDFCDLVVLADEDPRGEDGLGILRQIAAGCRGLTEGKNLLLERDRKKAIHMALSQAKKGDTVLLLGKGHEESIIYAGGPVQWDEAETARTALKEMGFKR